MHSKLSLCGRSGIGIPHHGHTGGGFGKDTFQFSEDTRETASTLPHKVGVFLRRAVCDGYH
jgi:hypothetical protein